MEIESSGVRQYAQDNESFQALKYKMTSDLTKAGAKIFEDEFDVPQGYRPVIKKYKEVQEEYMGLIQSDCDQKKREMQEILDAPMILLPEEFDAKDFFSQSLDL